MTALPCTALTTACLALLLFVLSVRVVWLRLRLGQPLGDGGDARLARALRVQGNFIEYVPLSLLVMLLLEWHGAPAVGLQAYGAALVLARTVHALAVSRLQERLVWRILSTALTLALLSGGAVALLLAAWPRAV
ncbi:MAPEG family protein [Pseudaquabacterium rugosum]|uniref:MAPEG family protein n=1 Tax=Pseudaquabacterium rugosum TaxID=2984194 RepID=A0ABU9BDQ5_9BURK